MLRFFDLENNFSDYIHHINLPANLHVSYKKWLRYYLDFCHKYHHDRNNQSLLAPLFQKLKQKEQNKQQCENYHDIYPCCPAKAERSSKSARFAVKERCLHPPQSPSKRGSLFVCLAKAMCRFLIGDRNDTFSRGDSTNKQVQAIIKPE